MHHTIRTPRGARPRAVGVTIGAVALMLVGCQDSIAPNGNAVRAPNAAAHDAANNGSQIPDEYIIVFNDSVGDVTGRANALLGTHGGNLHQTYSNALKGFSAHMSAQGAAELANDPNVAYVEQDQTLSTAGMFSSGTQKPAWEWGLDRIDQRPAALDTSYSWMSDGTGVTVYIFDTGIRITHQDFGGRAVYGPDFVSNTSSNDCNGHGTHMAGTVGGTVYGVAKNVSLVAVRVLDCSGNGTASTAIAALDWVIQNHATPSVVNMSFAGPSSASLNQAVASAIAAGVTVVAAAGDYGVPPDACQYSPASAPGAITVGASRLGDSMAGFSNYGKCVTLFAPGMSITSDWWTGDNIVWALDGSSSAAAHVSGAAAIYLSMNPSATPAAVASSIVGSATTGLLTQLGAGSPNLLLYTGDPSVPQPNPAPPPPPPGNTPPTASFLASCVKNKCSFDGSASTDNSGIASYGWAFGDGTSQTTSGPKTTHTYSSKGNYSVTVTLTVTDNGGMNGSMKKTLNIKNSGK